MIKTQVQMFYSKQGFSALQDEINAWLDERPDLEVINISHADNKDYCTAVVVYRFEEIEK